MTAAIEQLVPEVGLAPACQAFGYPRATWYRHRMPKAEPIPRSSPPRALAPGERDRILALLRSDDFVDQAPPTIVATLLDRDTFLCSARTMYRILGGAAEVRERRNQLRHPAYTKPELLAQAPRQVWTWDITKLRGPAKWSWYNLYVILDLFSRYVVGWMLAESESAELAVQLIGEACDRERIARNELSIHSDRGAPMTSKTVSQLLSDLDVMRSLSRPHVSNDNPFSESHFKTLKYRPTFPRRFGSAVDAREFCRSFFDWYNHHHRHSGIAWLTPADVHHGRAAEILTRRQAALTAAFEAHPERFVRKPPVVPQLPSAVWINPPIRPQEPRAETGTARAPEAGCPSPAVEAVGFQPVSRSHQAFTNPPANPILEAPVLQ